MKHATIVTIGDEILIGQIIDSNSAWIAKQLNQIGIDVTEILSLPDEKSAIVSGMTRASKSDLVLITGGLGPTKDDITKLALAEYFEDQLVFNEAMWKSIQQYFKSRGRSTTPLHKDQCYLPSKAKALENKMGTAPGMLIDYQNTIFISMPGVPYEMKYIMTEEVIPRLNSSSELSIYHKTILTIGKGESVLSELIKDIEQSLPKHIKLAFLPSLGKVRIRLSGRSNSVDSLKTEIDQYVEKISDRLSAYIYGYDDISIEQAIGELCIKKNKSIATAESCTGGLLSYHIVSSPGASGYFKGAVVAYSNELKKDLLNVPAETLNKHGAVSEETVRDMVLGVLAQTEADIAVAVSGIAGPDGGTEAKPVGTICLACGDKDDIITKTITIQKTRKKNIEYSVNQALNMLRERLVKS